MFVFIMFRLPQKYKHGQCSQNTSIMQRCTNINNVEKLKLVLLRNTYLQCIYVVFTFMFKYIEKYIESTFIYAE